MKLGLLLSALLVIGCSQKSEETVEGRCFLANQGLLGFQVKKDLGHSTYVISRGFMSSTFSEKLITEDSMFVVPNKTEVACEFIDLRVKGIEEGNDE